MEALPEGISQYDIMQAREDEVTAAHPYIPDVVMDEVFAAEADRLNSPSSLEHGYMEDPATQAMLDRLDSRFALVQGNPLAIEIMARREVEAMNFINGLDRAAVEAGSPSSSGGESGGGWESGRGRDRDRGRDRGDDLSGGERITGAGDLSGDAGITTGDFPSPGTWSDGGDHGTPDPGLPVNPDYTGIQPVILDLDGDGVEIAVNSQISFDWDGDTFLESGNWAAADDGFLVVDLEADGSIGTRGGDGVIDQGREIAFSQWAGGNATDLQALFEATDASGKKVFDSHDDGRLTAADDIWASMKVWQDSDQDGEVDAGELRTLDQLGISEITLTYDDGSSFSETDDDVEALGNILHGLASYVMNGKKVTGGVGDVSLVYNTHGWKRVETDNGYTIEFEAGDDLVFWDMANRKDKAANADLTAAGLAGGYGDGRNNRLSATGSDRDVVITGGAGRDTLLGGRGDDLLSGGEGADTIRGGDGNDVVIADGADNIAGGFVTGGGGYDRLIVSADTVLNLADFAKTQFEALEAGDQADRVIVTGGNTHYSLSGNGGNDTLRAAGGNDLLSGGAGADVLSGGAGADRLLGGEGADKLNGGDGADFLTGGAGNDTLRGGGGNDIYFFDRGDGHDTILDEATGTRTIWQQYEADVLHGSGKRARYVNEMRTGLVQETGQIDGGIDTLKFGAGISIEDVIFSRSGENAVLHFRNHDNPDTPDIDESHSWPATDRITIEKWANQDNRIENFAFADGTVIDVSRVLRGRTGDADANTLTGTRLGEWMNAGDGNDTLDAGAGRDILIGGNGNDSLLGGAGRDILLGGQDVDTLRGGDGDDYLLGGNGNDKLFGGNGADALMGGDGHDSLTGGAGQDMLHGGRGNDRLEGGGGNDTYFFFRGDGHDTISDVAIASAPTEVATGGMVYQRHGKQGRYVQEMRTVQVGEVLDGGWDALQFGYGIKLEDIFFKLDGANLVMGVRERNAQGGPKYLANLEDVVTIENWADPLHRIEELRFGDGRAIDISHFDRFVSGYDADNLLRGGNGNDLLSGGRGDDTLNGGKGNDVLSGGAGDDVLNAGWGDDDLIGNAGADTLRGNRGQDFLQGGDGNDLLDAGIGNDVLSGGHGDDTLRGGRGNDIYIFNRGDGHDLIDESVFSMTENGTTTYVNGDADDFTGSRVGSGKKAHNVWVNDTRTGAVVKALEGGDDTLQFGNFIDIGDLVVNATGAGVNDDLVIELIPLIEGDPVSDSVTIHNFATLEFQIETFRFANGFVLDVSRIGYAITGLATDDTINLGGISLIAGAGAWLGGGGGDDTITGSSENDILIGGGGNDRLEGGKGDDIYVFSRGDGHDTIHDLSSSAVSNAQGGDKLLFGAGITIEDLVLERNGHNLVIHVLDNDNLTTPLADSADTVTVTNWATSSRRVELLQFFNGLDFDISGIKNTYLGGDLLGNDTVGAVNDTLVGSHASDWIDGFAGNDHLQGGRGDDFLFGREGNDTLEGGRQADILAGGGGNDVLSGGLHNDVLTGGSGMDSLRGDDGHDVLMGGTGDDTLDGGTGNDLIVGDQGDDVIIASFGNDEIRFGFGDGNDLYKGADAAGIRGTDTIVFENDVQTQDIWFAQVEDDLMILLHGSEDRLVIQDWFSPTSAGGYVRGFVAQGEFLDHTKVAGLVNAMKDKVMMLNDGTTAYGLMPGDTPATILTEIDNAWA